jgi:hypothetical protein
MAAIHKTGDAFPLVLAVKLDLPNGANCQSLCALHSATPVCESKTSGKKVTFSTTCIIKPNCRFFVM